MNFPQSGCGVPQGGPQYVVPISWFKMAARALAEHLSSRKEAGEQCDGEGRAKKAPLQCSVPLLMGCPRNPLPSSCPHPPSRQAGKYGLSAERVVTPCKMCFY